MFQESPDIAYEESDEQDSAGLTDNVALNTGTHLHTHTYTHTQVHTYRYTHTYVVFSCGVRCVVLWWRVQVQ